MKAKFKIHKCLREDDTNICYFRNMYVSFHVLMF